MNYNTVVKSKSDVLENNKEKEKREKKSVLQWEQIILSYRVHGYYNTKLLNSYVAFQGRKKKSLHLIRTTFVKEEERNEDLLKNYLISWKIKCCFLVQQDNLVFFLFLNKSYNIRGIWKALRKLKLIWSFAYTSCSML